MNTSELLNISNAICPDRKFIIFDRLRQTYAQTYERVNRLANALRGLGVQKGDRIGMLQINCSQYVESYFAAVKVGAIFVPLNFRAISEELSYMIAKTGVKVLFAGARYLGMVTEMLSRLPALKHCIYLDQGQAAGIDYEDLLGASSPEDKSEEIGEADITVLMYTSGTTGHPKGVPLRHSGFVSYVLENVEPANPEIEERNLLTVPLYHIAGMQAMLAAVYGGRTLVMMRQFETEEWLKMVQQHKVTRAMLVPTMLKWIIDHPNFNAYDLSSLKVVTYGAAPMPYAVIKKAIAELPGVRFINAFGQTETTSTITVLGPEDHIIEGTAEEKEKKLNRLCSSIGRPLPDVEVRIADDVGNALPPGRVGEIVARGPRIMTGYWEDSEKTQKVMTADGWLRTGDQGWMDTEGYIYLAGRVDDIIIRGGENISPEEIENVLCSFAKIDEAACIGVPDPEWGQEPKAIVVLKQGVSAAEEDIIEFCRGKLAGFKRPRSVVFVDSLPRNPMGKVIKKMLREKYGKHA